MAKKVVFVQGTAFSGSTFFHLMLANDPHGFACGEVHGLFRPHKNSHVERECVCGYNPCRTWPKILEKGEAHLYQSIFALHPETEFIVESSKQPFWIRAQNENLRRQNVAFHNILIWKTPLDFASSKQRRGQPNWDGIWLHTHRLYLSFMSGIRAVRYEDMAKDHDALRRVCEYVDIPYFPGKENFWEKQHCVLGGSKTAKSHLVAKEEAAALHQSESLQQKIPHRTVDYVPVEDAALQRQVERRLAEEPLFAKLEQLLNYADISNAGYDPAEFQALAGDIAVPWHVVLLKQAKYELRMLQGRIRYRNAPRFAAAA